MPVPQSDPTAASGIHTLPTGHRHIPPSTRADGSQRREIKIRPGYKPPEDVGVYKNRTAEGWKNRGSGGGVPGAEGLRDEKEEGEKEGGWGSKKKRRRGGGGKKKNEEEGEGDGEDIKEAEEVVLEEQKGEGEGKKVNDPSADREKQARALKKKLRQARELRAKKESGEGLLPEQVAKVIKIQELVRQLEGLGVGGVEEEEEEEEGGG